MGTNDSESSSPIPGDLSELSDWLPIARRLRQVAIQNGTPAIIRITILSDENGTPRLYAIRSTRIEPKAKVEDVIEWLAGDEPKPNGLAGPLRPRR